MRHLLSTLTTTLFSVSCVFISNSAIAAESAQTAPPPPPSMGFQAPPAPVMEPKFTLPPMPQMALPPAQQPYFPPPPNFNQAPPRFQPMPGQNFNTDMFRQSMTAELDRAKQLTKPTPQMPTAEINAMREQLSRLVGQQEQLMSMLQSQNVKQAALETQLKQGSDTRTARIAELEKELETAKAVSTDLEAANARIAELEKSAANASSAGEAKIKESEKALQLAIERATAAETELANSKKAGETRAAKFQGMQQQLAGSETRFTELQGALDAAKLQLANTAISAENTSDLQAKLDAVTAELETKSTALTGSEEKLAELQAKLEATTPELESKTAALAGNEEKLAELQAKLDATTPELETKTTALSEAEEKLAALQADNEKCQTEISELKKEIAALTEKIDASEKAAAAEKLKNTDTDEDGVSDADDRCSGTMKGAKVNETGCEPDTDNDGLVDRVDLCPNTPEGKEIDSAGCHSEATIALEGVNFTLGTAQLTASSSEILDSMVETLQKFPELSLEVAGHTDDNGSPGRNTKLSAQRAESVKKYLVEKGVDEARLEAKGYGSSEPIASNETDAGQAANRRVELRRK